MNRQQRRNLARSSTKSSKVTDRVRPSNQIGVEVDEIDGKVVLTCHQMNAIFTIEWGVADAKVVAKMITDAATKENATMPEVVRDSGIVVAHDLPDS